MKLKSKLLTLVLLTSFLGLEAYGQQRNPDRRDRNGSDRRGEVTPPDRGRDDRGTPDRGRPDYGRDRAQRPHRPGAGERQTAFMARQLVSSTQELVDQVQWEVYRGQHRVLRVAQNLEYQATQLARTVARYDDQSRVVRQAMNQFIMDLNHAQDVFYQARLSWHVDQNMREVKQDARQLRQALTYNDRGRGGYYEEDYGHSGGSKKSKLKKIGKAALIGAAIIGIIDIID